jgi:hypothetical protein
MVSVTNGFDDDRSDATHMTYTPRWKNFFKSPAHEKAAKKTGRKNKFSSRVELDLWPRSIRSRDQAMGVSASFFSLIFS